MGDQQQQYCLRWNNHQSTLISVFDSLLESNIFVDCTLAAEGQYLKAHKVVLCACSPYLELLLSQHCEKHPIVILKDIKFYELKCMLDYMYRGEVNISQEHLGTFLKAAESLQIKGLTDSSVLGENDSRDVDCIQSQAKRYEAPSRKVAPVVTQSRSPTVFPPHISGLTIEPSNKRSILCHANMNDDSPNGSREGSLSPTMRKRRRHRKPSQGEEHFNQNIDVQSICDTVIRSQLAPISNVPSVVSQILSNNISSANKVPPIETDKVLANVSESTVSTIGYNKFKTENAEMEQMLDPKTEYFEDMNSEENIEDLTLEEDDLDGMDGSDTGAGPSHSADSSNQGYPWPVSADRSNDEMFIGTQEASGSQADSQGNFSTKDIT